MRALISAIFVLGTTFYVVNVIGKHYPGNHWPWWAVPAILATLFATFVLSFVLFNILARRRGSRENNRDRLADLEKEGLLISEPFKARRAFQVEEFEDEGAHYFIELEDGTVLYLNGQYLYYYDGTINTPESGNARLFPSTDFTLRKHRMSKEIVDVICAGSVLPLDCEAPPFDEDDEKRALIPTDGDLIRDRSYDQLKRERLRDKRPARSDSA